MPARPCRLEERSRCVRDLPHFVPPLHFGKLRRCAYSPRPPEPRPSAERPVGVIGLSDRLGRFHHLLARDLYLVQPGPLVGARPGRLPAPLDLLFVTPGPLSACLGRGRRL